MKTATVDLKNVSPYSQSRAYMMDQPKLSKEGPDDYEKRTWMYRLHVNDDGKVFIPPMSFKNALSEAAKYNPRKIPGQGKATYTKNFEAGVLVIEPVVLPLRREDVPGEWLHVPADGKRGGDRRVFKCFPVIKEWSGKVRFHLLDDTITKEIFEETLRDAGQFIGIGRFQPRKNGFYGRFDIKHIDWE